MKFQIEYEPKFWTDRRFGSLGDDGHLSAPIRRVRIIGWCGGDSSQSLVVIEVEEKILLVHYAHIFTTPCRLVYGAQLTEMEVQKELDRQNRLNDFGGDYTADF